MRLNGITDEQRVPTAEFTIGLRADKPRVGSVTRRRGSLIGEETAIRELHRLRTRQVGKRAAASTIRECKGRWQDTSEPTLECKIKFLPSSRERRDGTFVRHMLVLGERLAERLAQKEILLDLEDHTYRINAPYERGPRPARRQGRVLR